MRYKYMILITGDISLTNKEPTEEEFQNANDGDIDIINLEDQTIYDSGEWHPIMKIE